MFALRQGKLSKECSLQGFFKERSLVKECAKIGNFLCTFSLGKGKKERMFLRGN